MTAGAVDIVAQTVTLSRVRANIPRKGLRKGAEEGEGSHGRVWADLAAAAFSPSCPF